MRFIHLSSLRLLIAISLWSLSQISFSATEQPSVVECQEQVQQAQMSAGYIVEGDQELASEEFRGRWYQIYQLLQANQYSCYHDAQYLALLGVAQFYIGQVAAARDTLERALLLDPQQRQARIFYAQSLYSQGEPFAAYQLNQQLLGEAGLSSVERQMLQQRQMIWQQRFKQSLYNIRLGVGHDDNLNSAADIDSLFLTLADGGSLNLNLAESSQPVSAVAFYTELEAQWRSLTPTGHYQWQLLLQGQHSAYDHDQQQLILGYAHQVQHKSLSQIANPNQNDSVQWQSQWQLNLHHARYDHQVLYQGVELGLEMQQYFPSNTQLRYPLQLFWQQFPSNAQQDGIEIAFQPQVSYIMGAQGLVSIGGGLNYNHALNQRSGGDSYGYKGFAQIQYQALGGVWRINGLWLQSQDREGYSALLENGAVRKSQRVQLALGYDYSLASQLQLNTRWQVQRNRSNLPLFHYDRNQVQIELEWQLR